RSARDRAGARDAGGAARLRARARVRRCAGRASCRRAGRARAHQPAVDSICRSVARFSRAHAAALETLWPVLARWPRGATRRRPVPFFVHARHAVRESHARPAAGREGAPWQIGDAPALRRESDGPPHYRARIGARVEPYGVYWLRVLERDGSRLVVENCPELGKRDIPRVRTEIEDTFVRPALRGRDVRRDSPEPQLSALLVQDPLRRAPIPLERMRDQ